MTNKIESIIPPKLKNFVELQGIQSSKRVFKRGSIELNGSKFQISSSDTLESFAAKINGKKHITKVEAVVISTESQTKLLLKSKNKELNLKDSTGIFKDHYKTGKLGVNKKSLIQVIRDCPHLTPSDISLNYSVNFFRQPAIGEHTLSEFNKLELSRFDTNTQASLAPLVHEPKVPAITPLDPAAKKKTMIGISRFIIDSAIYEAIRDKNLDVPSDELQKRLTNELGNRLYSKYRHLSITDFNKKNLALTHSISKEIANAHELSWIFMRNPFLTEKLTISDQGIANIKRWIKNNLHL